MPIPLQQKGVAGLPLPSGSEPLLPMRLLLEADGESQLGDYYARVLPLIRGHLQARVAAIAATRVAGWEIFGAEGAAALPAELLGEVLDSDEPRSEGSWSVYPLLSLPGYQALLAIDRGGHDAAAVICGLSAAIVRIISHNRQTRRLRELETILTITSQWAKTRNTEPLLCQMAEAATQLLSADRASIFLWDREGKTLVGRPALGVASGELRIADNTGIVGQVVQSGQLQRVARGELGEQVDRQVDRQLGYQTECVLCVPLLGTDGGVIGAFEVLNKRQGDFDYQDELSLLELADHAAAALENTQQLEQLLNTNRQLTGQAAASVQLIGRCAAIERLRSTIERVAKTDLTVLILGENGTGKEVVARKIHYQSDRCGAAFVAVNCAAVPDTLWESELFGHEQGAFTDAHQTQIGKFELAANGTLFLDEIAELSPAGQAKLLRVLEEKSIMRVGGSVPISTDVRVVVATNQNLIERVRQGSFREDLYFRVDVVSLQLPPLRDRGEDILLLFNQFLSRFAQKVGRKRPQLTAGGRKRLLAHSWPGNIRELRNLAERLVYLTIDEKIEAEALEFILAPHAAVEWIEDDLPLGEATIQFQRQYIARAIARSEENMSQAAARLGLHRSNLYRKLRQLEAGTGAQ